MTLIFFVRTSVLFQPESLEIDGYLRSSGRHMNSSVRWWGVGEEEKATNGTHKIYV